MLAGHTGKYGRFEIERKFALKEVPQNFLGNFHDLHDTYLPNSSLRLRIVRSSSGEILSRNLTQKHKASEYDSTISIMTSIYLTEGDLDALGSLDGAIVEKRRYFHETENNRVTIDVFTGSLLGLVMAEVEFQNESARDNYVPPNNWEEVTGNQNYSCGYLAFNPSKCPMV